MFLLSMFLNLSKLSSLGVLEEGGGGQQASCLVAKQAVVFPQVLASELLMREDQHGKGL